MNTIIKKNGSIIENNDKINTHTSIDNETHTVYDRDVVQRSIASIEKTTAPVFDKLIHYNCEHFDNISEQLSTFVGNSDLISINVSNTSDDYKFKRPICPKMIEFRTERELMTANRMKFITPHSTKPNTDYDQYPNVANYCSSPQDMGEKEYRSMMRDIVANYCNDARMTVCKLERLSDSTFFYFAHFVQEFKQTSDNRESYLQIIRAINTLFERYSDLPIILTGTFNVKNNYALLTKYFDTSLYHVCDFNNMPTMLSNVYGAVASDGLIVSKQLYTRLQYHTEFNYSCSRQISSLVIHAKMFIDHNLPGTYPSEDWPLRAVMSRVPTDDFDHSDNDAVRSYSTEQTMVRVLTGNREENNGDDDDD
ncbi:MAG: hypothetical protein ACRYE7_00200, partial [Janthinobacterium lividum]